METASEAPLSLWHSGSKNDPRYRVNETLTPDASSACPRIAGLKSQRWRRANLRRIGGSRIAGLPRRVPCQRLCVGMFSYWADTVPSHFEVSYMPTQSRGHGTRRFL